MHRYGVEQEQVGRRAEILQPRGNHMWKDHESRIDYLNHAAVAERIATLLTDTQAYPLSLGVLGGWGSGKTTMLRLIEGSISTADTKADFLLVWFDAWRVEGYDEIRAALLEAIAKRLEKLPGAVNDQDHDSPSLLSRINLLRAFAMIAGLGSAISGIPTVATSGFSNIFAGVGAAAASIEGMVSKVEQSGSSSLQEISRTISDILAANDKHLLVFVDNIDRCTPDNAIRVLEVMRNVLFLPRTGFVFALDETVLRAAVRRHYQIENNSDTVSDYIDKFIQVSFRLRPLPAVMVERYLLGLFLERGTSDGLSGPAIHEFLADLYKHRNSLHDTLEQAKLKYCLNGAQVSELRQFIELAHMFASAPAINGNPRSIKRVLNTAELMSRTDLHRDQPELFRALIKLIVFQRSVSPSASTELEQMLASEDSDARKKLELLERAAGSGTLQTAELPYEWRGIEPAFLERWLKLRPLMSAFAGNYALSSMLEKPISELDGKARELLHDLAGAMESLDSATKPSSELLLRQYPDDLLEQCAIAAIRGVRELQGAQSQERNLIVLAALAVHGGGARSVAMAFLKSPEGSRALSRAGMTIERITSATPLSSQRTLRN